MIELYCSNSNIHPQMTPYRMVKCLQFKENNAIFD